MSTPETDEKTTPASAGSTCSAASLKADAGKLKEQLSNRYWGHDASTRDLQSLMELVEKMAGVIEAIERRLPPNDQAQAQPPTATPERK